MRRALVVFLILFISLFLMGTVQAAPVNWALSGTATQSSDFFLSGDANFAIDGNTGGAWWGTPPDRLTHTNLEQNPWWKVDLGSEKSIDRIDIWNRIDERSESLTNRLFPFTVSIIEADGDTAWSSTYGTLDSIHMIFDLPAATAGRFVRIQHNGTNYLHLAEVQVWGDYGSEQNAPVPVPSTIFLLGVGLLGFSGLSRRKK